MGLLPTALFMQLVVVVEPFGFGFGSDDTFRNLYATNETGITSFETVELANTLKDSETPWLIEFYSSWCGHCVRYSSTYKELGVRTKGEPWRGRLKGRAKIRLNPSLWIIWSRFMLCRLKSPV